MDRQVFAWGVVTGSGTAGTAADIVNASIIFVLSTLPPHQVVVLHRTPVVVEELDGERSKEKYSQQVRKQGGYEQASTLSRVHSDHHPRDSHPEFTLTARGSFDLTRKSLFTPRCSKSWMMAAKKADSSDSSWVSGNADLSTPPRCMMMYRFRSTSAAWILGGGGGQEY